MSKDIYENKPDETLEDAEAAKREEEEIIRIAHIPDDAGKIKESI